MWLGRTLRAEYGLGGDYDPGPGVRFEPTMAAAVARVPPEKPARSTGRIPAGRQRFPGPCARRDGPAHPTTSHYWCCEARPWPTHFVADYGVIGVAEMSGL